MRLLWLLPAVVLVVVSVFSYANTDTTRDYLMAWHISNGLDVPLLGPQMAFSFDIGPWWFYLLSLVVWIDPSWLTTAVLTAALNGCKFYLAYRVGLRLADHRMGLCLLAALCLVSVNLMQSITFTHTNLVEPMMLLVIFLVLNPDFLLKNTSWLLLGVLLSAVFHAHPTAALVGYFVFLQWLRCPQKLSKALLFVLGFLLLFLPVIYNSFIHQETLLDGVSKYFGKHLGSFSPMAYINTLAGLLIYAPYAMFKAVLNSQWAAVLVTIQLVIQAMALLASVKCYSQLNPATRKLLIHLWWFFLLSCLGLVLIRIHTPWYMTYGVNLSLSLITGIGLYATLRLPFGKLLTGLALGSLMLMFIITQSATAHHLNKGTLVVPSLVLKDIKFHNTALSFPSYEINAINASAHGQFTCERSPVSIHGPYSNLLFAHSAMEHLSECTQPLYYGPSEDHNHLIGVPQEFARIIKIQADHRIGNTWFYQPLDVSDAQTHWTEDHRHDYQRRIKINKQWQNTELDTELHGGQHLIVTNLLGFRMPMKVISVSVNGQPLEAAEQHTYSTLYLCESCEVGDTHWQVSYQEGVSGMTNVVSF